MTDRKLMQQALEALKFYYDQHGEESDEKVITALRDRLAQPEQEPVAWRWKERINGDFDSWVISVSEPPPYAIEKQPLYTAPPQRQPLTDEQIDKMIAACGFSSWSEWPEFRDDWVELVRFVEAANGIRTNDAA